MLKFKGQVSQLPNGYSLRFVDETGKAVSVQISAGLMHDYFGIFDVTTVDVADCAFEIGEVATKKYCGTSPLVVHTQDFERV